MAALLYTQYGVGQYHDPQINNAFGVGEMQVTHLDTRKATTDSECPWYLGGMMQVVLRHVCFAAAALACYYHYYNYTGFSNT